MILRDKYFIPWWTNQMCSVSRLSKKRMYEYTVKRAEFEFKSFMRPEQKSIDWMEINSQNSTKT